VENMLQKYKKIIHKRELCFFSKNGVNPVAENFTPQR